MRITISDIRNAADFAKRLERACDDILSGETRTEALGREGISLSVFLTLIKGLKRTSQKNDTSSEEDLQMMSDCSEQQMIEELRNPVWQDEIARDVTGDEYFYLPTDFEEAFRETMERVLDDEEQKVILSLYPKRNTYDRTADELGLSPNTVRARRKSALKKLKEHQDEFIYGKKYIMHLAEIRKKQDEYQQTLDWMDEAGDYLDELETDEQRRIENQSISPEALAFYRRNGLVTLADVVEHTLSELFVRVTDAADGEGAFLAAVASDGFDMDSELDESIGLDTKTANAFNAAGIHTVREFMALPEEKAFSIKGVGPKTVIYMYRRVLFG